MVAKALVLSYLKHEFFFGEFLVCNLVTSKQNNVGY